MKPVSKSKSKGLLNRVLDKAIMVVRDINLPENLEGKYISGTIILQ